MERGQFGDEWQEEGSGASKPADVEAAGRAGRASVFAESVESGFCGGKAVWGQRSVRLHRGFGEAITAGAGEVGKLYAAGSVLHHNAALCEWGGDSIHEGGNRLHGGVRVSGGYVVCGAGEGI